jgi:hypothetical protein
MDPSSLVSSFVSVVATAFFAALKDRSVRTFENKTKRIQFWKTMLETASLADVTEVGFIKEQCQREMDEAINAVAIESNEFVGSISTKLVLVVEVLIALIMAHISMEMLDTIRQQGVPPTTANNFAVLLAIVQSAVLVYVWFWGRGRIKLWIWNEIKPGASLEALRLNKCLQGAVGLLTIFIILGVILWWLVASEHDPTS